MHMMKALNAGGVQRQALSSTSATGSSPNTSMQKRMKLMEIPDLTPTQLDLQPTGTTLQIREVIPH